MEILTGTIFHDLVKLIIKNRYKKREKGWFERRSFSLSLKEKEKNAYTKLTKVLEKKKKRREESTRTKESNISVFQVTTNVAHGILNYIFIKKNKTIAVRQISVLICYEVSKNCPLFLY